MPHDGHDVGQGAAQAGEFGDDEGVALFEPFQHGAEFAFLFVFLSADHFHHPTVDGQVSVLGETADFVLLVGEVLFAGADSQVGDDHGDEG